MKTPEKAAQKREQASKRGLVLSLVSLLVLDGLLELAMEYFATLDTVVAQYGSGETEEVSNNLLLLCMVVCTAVAFVTMHRIEYTATTKRCANTCPALPILALSRSTALSMSTGKTLVPVRCTGSR